MNIFRDTMTYGMAHVLSKLIQFALLPIVAKSMSVHEFGQCFFALSVANLAPLLYNGFRGAVYHTILTSGEERYLTSGLIGQVLISLLLSSATFFFLTNTISTNYLLLASASIFVQQINSYGLEFFLLRMRTYLYSFCYIFQSALLFFFVVMGTPYLFSLLLSYCFITPIVLYNLYPYLSNTYDWKFIRTHAKEGMPLTISGIAHFFLTNIDRWMLEKWGAPEELGIYTMALKITNPLTFVLLSFKNAWGPRFLNVKEFFPIAGKKYVEFLCLFATLILLTQILSPFYLTYFTPEVYWGAKTSITYLGIAIFFQAIISFFDYSIYVAKKYHVLMIGTWLACLLNGGLNALLIPKWGAEGAALATAISTSFLALCYGVVSQIYHPIPFPKGRSFILLTLFLFGFFPAPLLLSLRINKIRDKLSFYYERTRRTIFRGQKRSPLSARKI